MRLFLLILITVLGLTQGASRAGPPEGSENGNLIPEPKLHDYLRAERTPGFSPIIDIVDSDGKPVRN